MCAYCAQWNSSAFKKFVLAEHGAGAYATANAECEPSKRALSQLPLHSNDAGGGSRSGATAVHRPRRGGSPPATAADGTTPAASSSPVSVGASPPPLAPTSAAAIAPRSPPRPVLPTRGLPPPAPGSADRPAADAPARSKKRPPPPATAASSPPSLLHALFSSDRKTDKIDARGKRRRRRLPTAAGDSPLPPPPAAAAYLAKFPPPFVHSLLSSDRTDGDDAREKKGRRWLPAVANADRRPARDNSPRSSDDGGGGGGGGGKSPRGRAYTEEEDRIITRAAMAERDFSGWAALVATINALSDPPTLPARTGKQIRDRWVNFLNPSLNHRPWSREEDARLWRAHAELGNRWTDIGVEKFHTTRSENQVKNRWHSAAFKRYAMEEYGKDAHEEATRMPTMTLGGPNDPPSEV